MTTEKQLDLFESEHFTYQNHINPDAQQQVTDTVTEELQFLINNMFDNFDDFFEFDKDDEVTEDQYVDWVSAMINKAVAGIVPNV